MPYRRLVCLAAAITLLSATSFAQSVISAHAGLIQLFDGAVFLDERPLLGKAGKFEQMGDGSVLRTADGRAEVSLTPGVFLRLADHSAIHMVSNHLADTRVRFLSGSAIVEVSKDPVQDAAPTLKAPVTILAGDYQVRIAKEGLYRLNETPKELKVDRGEARVELDGHSAEVAAGFVLSMEDHALVAKRFTGGPDDRLDAWSKSRDNSIAQENLEAANTNDLSGQIDNWQNDRDSYLEALGMSSYLPALPLSGYTPLSGSALLGVTPMGLYGTGYGGLYGLYSYPYLRYYPGAAYGIYGYRRPTTIIGSPARIGVGLRPIYPPSVSRVGGPPPSVHVPSPMHPPTVFHAPAPMAHPAPIHVGGGRR